ncbi:MAG: hypothetical protein ACE1ZQ_07060, partial [Ignavibacteriaceae bacterium]
KPNEKELNATTVVSIDIDETSAKIRTCPPKDDEEDYNLPVWAGVLRLNQGFDKFIPDPVLNPDDQMPGYLKDLIRNKKNHNHPGLNYSVSSSDLQKPI